jgi:hypothetical protein
MVVESEAPNDKSLPVFVERPIVGSVEMDLPAGKASAIACVTVSVSGLFSLPASSVFIVDLFLNNRSKASSWRLDTSRAILYFWTFHKRSGTPLCLSPSQ